MNTLETNNNTFKEELEILEKAIIGIRKTIDFEKSENIFTYYNEIKYHNYNSDSSINYNLCLNKINMIINELNILGIDNSTMDFFYKFKAFILTKKSPNEEEIENIKDNINNIIYL